ncbi:hypothetical protein [Streptomyces sp. NPDC001270]|uniref:hypothetical protein n=1 Tax=Streptomyces sp. NPDC001270 TaxID=3364554 RepID=UPI003681FB3D
MDPIHPTDHADLTAYTHNTVAATFADVTNAAALAAKTIRTSDTPPRATGRILARALLATARRMLDVQTALDNTRAAIARHVAAADDGEDPSTADLLAILAEAGQPIGADTLANGAAEHAAKAVAW